MEPHTIQHDEPYCPWCSDGEDAPTEECCGLPGCKPEAVDERCALALADAMRAGVWSA